LVAHRSERKSLVEGVFTRGELTKQPSGLFFKRGRFARESVPLLWSYLNLPADLIGTLIKIEVFLQSEGRLEASLEIRLKFFICHRLQRH